ncbi:YbaK/EbsC family protein [Plastorhodobacter daqingensis]|uniref:YbaK/EbsC family protein n=1 Tax=Plastorhodobacter daqingensis TaxID=1387281 RepID=A0ABW2UIW5_9RHOB
MSKSVTRVREALKQAGESGEILEMQAETRTAAQAADAAGCGLDQIVKSIVFRGDRSGRLFLFLTAGGNQVCAAKASALAGEPLGKAEATQIRTETGFAIGGVAPVGHLTPIRSFCDPRLHDFPLVWAAAGTPRHIFAITPERLLAVSGAERQDFTV